MRKLLSCVLMMTLLLAGCAAGQEEESPEQLTNLIRGEYLSLESWSARVEVTASYGGQAFPFTLDAEWSREGESVFTVVSPELIAGITARIRDGEAALEYDGAGLSIGALDADGLTPIAALPALMDQLGTGCIARCAWDGEGEARRLLLECRDPEGEEGQGTEYSLWFYPDTHALDRAEVSVDGALCLTLKFSDFTMEMSQDETGDHADLGGD